MRKACPHKLLFPKDKDIKITFFSNTGLVVKSRPLNMKQRNGILRYPSG